ncbi:hypothetical protein NJC40_03470 [Pseudomonas sp. 21LCFQ02]|uniref:hypothetical protein n=1 Tax=Pseudomonas sp. 21LCFQ02 TaxID=2957505 RepID=UPI00209A7A5D|nr:hypothetical protein [Pseudomonas sp. 21LCFQ02]MCO8166837.1 hypothetical protein [Pseudomonas sp. 21LCFQ02]
MKVYITAEQVDGLQGADWAPEDKKPRAVMMANVWMTNRKLPDIDPMPVEWEQAASEIAIDAANGRLYGARETGVTSKSVKAGEVSSSKTFRDGATTYTSGESFALALLSPWLQPAGGGMSQFKMVRG